MKTNPDINDTLREEGSDAVRARHDEAWRRRRGPKGVNGKEPPGDGITEGKKPKAGNGHDQLAPCTIEETLAVFERWLILRDLNPVYAVLGTVAANLLPCGVQTELQRADGRVRPSKWQLGLWSASSRLTPADMRPNEISESALRAAVNAVSAENCDASCLAKGVQRCLEPIVGFVLAERSIVRHASV